MDMQLPNHVYNSLKRHSGVANKRNQKLHEKKEHSTTVSSFLQLLQYLGLTPQGKQTYRSIFVNTWKVTVLARYILNLQRVFAPIKSRSIWNLGCLQTLKLKVSLKFLFKANLKKPFNVNFNWKFKTKKLYLLLWPTLEKLISQTFSDKVGRWGY